MLLEDFSSPYSIRRDVEVTDEDYEKCNWNQQYYPISQMLYEEETGNYVAKENEKEYREYCFPYEVILINKL